MLFQYFMKKTNYGLCVKWFIRASGAQEQGEQAYYAFVEGTSCISIVHIVNYIVLSNICKGKTIKISLIVIEEKASDIN